MASRGGKMATENPLYVTGAEPGTGQQSADSLSYNALYAKADSRVQFSPGGPKHGSYDFCPHKDTTNRVPWVSLLVSVIAFICAVVGIALAVLQPGCKCSTSSDSVMDFSDAPQQMYSPTSAIPHLSTTTPQFNYSLLMLHSALVRMMLDLDGLREHFEAHSNSSDKKFDVYNQDVTSLRQSIFGTESALNYLKLITSTLNNTLMDALDTVRNNTKAQEVLKATLTQLQTDSRMPCICNASSVKVQVPIISNISFSAQVATTSVPQSCFHIALSSATTPKNGFYELNDGSGGTFRVFCDFSSEDGWAWTLVESFSLGNNKEAFEKNPFIVSEVQGSFAKEVNAQSVNSNAFRLGPSALTSIAHNSTHWRSTCNFLILDKNNTLAVRDTAADSVYTDYVRSTFIDLNPVTVENSNTICRRVEVAYIGHDNCTDCKLPWRQTQGEHLRMIASSTSCDTDYAQHSPLPHTKTGEYWGRYSTKPIQFSCSLSNSSTTQFWFGSHFTSRQTCLDYLKRGNTRNGQYMVENGAGLPYSVYCDFESEAGAAWTLIESFHYDKASKFKSFTENNPMKDLSPNFNEYRLSRPKMLLLASSSTHWRATCRFQPGLHLQYSDYARARLIDANILTPVMDTKDVNGETMKMEYFSAYGVSCSECSISWYSGRNGKQHLHQSSHSVGDISFPTLSNPSADSFGFYGDRDSRLSCVSSPDSTTQWWIGGYM